MKTIGLFRKNISGMHFRLAYFIILIPLYLLALYILYKIDTTAIAFVAVLSATVATVVSILAGFPRRQFPAGGPVKSKTHSHQENKDGVLVNGHLLGTILEISSDYIYSVFVAENREPEFDWISDSFYKRFGYSMDELKNRGGLKSLIIEDDMHVYEKHVNKLIAGYEDTSELRLHSPDGVRWVRSTGKPVWNSKEKRVASISGAARDITEYKNLEASLKFKEESLNMILYNNPLPLYLFCSSTLEIIEVNEAALDLYGYSRDEMLKLRVSEIWSKDELEDFLKISESIKERKNFSGIWNHVNKAGGTMMMEINARQVKYAGREAFLIYPKNITYEKRLEFDNMLLAHSVRAISECVLITDPGEKIYYVNDAFLNTFGYTRDELIGKNSNIIGSSRSRKDLISDLFSKAMISSGWNGVIKSKRKNGEEFHVHLFISSIHNDKHELLGFVFVGSDISAQIKAENDLRDSNNELIEANAKLNESEKQLKILNANKDKFLSIISHDLRSPFHSLLGYSDILVNEAETLSREEIRSFSASIHSTAKLMLKAMDNILSWALIQTGRSEYVKEKFRLDETVIEVFATMAGNALKKNIRMNNFIGDNIQVFADRNSVIAVLQNLLSNAIKFTVNGGMVTVDAAEVDGYIEVRVTDNGVGMDNDLLEKLFKIENQTSRTGTANEKGTGIGLLLCKEHVEHNGGVIHAESEPGKGSVFSFTLPASDQSISRPA